MIHASGPSVRINLGDCREILPRIRDVDAVVTDPPYGLTANKKGGSGKASLNLNSPAGRSRISTGGGFMGQKWDGAVPGVEFWEQILAAMKPGAHLVAFGGTRTFHRLTCAIEDAGFEIRDCLMWLYGTGFPKSLNVSKAIDKAAGAEREVVGQYVHPSLGPEWANYPSCSAVEQSVNAYGDAGKRDRSITAPATDAAREWDGWGTALKPAWEPIILARKPLIGTVAANVLEHGTGALNIDGCRVGVEGGYTNHTQKREDTGPGWHPESTGERTDNGGRWPANLVLDEEAGAALGESSRFFYCAKANKKDRGEGNDHPTVKPQALMRYLCRLVTPPGGVVLDPFMGSGSTLLAAQAEGFRAIGIDTEERYCEIAAERLNLTPTPR